MRTARKLFAQSLATYLELRNSSRCVSQYPEGKTGQAGSKHGFPNLHCISADKVYTRSQSLYSRTYPHLKASKKLLFVHDRQASRWFHFQHASKLGTGPEDTERDPKEGWAGTMAGTKSSSATSSSTKRKRLSPAYYAVKYGHKPDVYLSWDDVQDQIRGFENPVCKLVSCLNDWVS